MTVASRRADRRRRARRAEAEHAFEPLAPTFPRLAGVLLPLAAAPSRHGVGDLGPGAYRFVKWCGEAGLGWWQMLPVGPLGAGNSPYSSSSAFAGERLYVALEGLVDEGLLATPDASAPARLGTGRARYREARAFKEPRFDKAHRAWLGCRRSRQAFDRFCAEAEAWLEPWVRHVAPDDPHGQDRERFLQHAFQRQWLDLRAAARANGVRLMGDAPIFVGADSADVAAHPELFRLEPDGRPTLLTGCPPDSFSDDGQLWGHPHYAWDAHRADGFAWWRRRIARQLELFDAVRIDHFIGFHRAWEVPGGAATARDGVWGPAPGRELLAAISEELGGRLPLVAEDLGAVDEEVLALRDAFALPGMRILQWGFAPDSYHAPHRCPENAAVYPGTHDNDTVRGWWRGLDAATRRRFRALTGGAAQHVPWDVWRLACGTAAHTAIAQLQDLLGLGRAARTNLPGTPTGNWTWRAERRDLSAGLARRCRGLVEATDRLPRL